MQRPSSIQATKWIYDNGFFIILDFTDFLGALR